MTKPEICDAFSFPLDWFDDTLVIDQDGKLILHNLKTEENTVVTDNQNINPDFSTQFYKYLGTIKID
ncbi:MAG: hypothetical protein V1716_04370 [Candidatus Uhrbacteria bacterium]